MNIDIKDLKKVSSVEEQKELLEYIGEDYKKVPYLYLDLEEYGIGKDNVNTWYYDNDEKIKCIFLLYYNCLHIYSRSLDLRLENIILNTINILNPHIIITTEEIGNYLKNVLNEQYRTICSCILDGTDVSTKGIHYNVEQAVRKDLNEIADLFLKSEHYQNVYSKEILLKQLENRYDSKFGRSFIVRDNGKIVGSLSTYGENDKFAIVSGLIIDASYGKPGVAMSLAKWMSKVLGEEGKRSLAINSIENERSIKFALKMGNVKVANIYEFIRL